MKSRLLDALVDPKTLLSQSLSIKIPQIQNPVTIITTRNGRRDIKYPLLKFNQTIFTSRTQFYKQYHQILADNVSVCEKQNETNY